MTRTDQAQPGVAIPPFQDCRPPLPGQTGNGPDGQVCTHVSIAGCTEPGKYFPDYADCSVVRTQQRNYPTPAAGTSSPDDPRLGDPEFMRELAWVTEQARATGCTCCHDSAQTPDGPSQWAIDHQPIWTDTASDKAIAILSGLADSSIFGAYPPEENNGFDRTITGIPSTDGERMRRFFVAELARRGLSEDDARAFPPIGGALAGGRGGPASCAEGVGIGADGRITWDPAARARYISVFALAGPGGPSAVWRLDVLASADALETGVAYGTTPPGSFQSFPESTPAAELEVGAKYLLFVARDMGKLAAFCTFDFPAVAAPTP